MAASDAPVISAPVLSQKQRRAALRKGRRKRKRQALAQAREIGLENGGSHTFEEAEGDDGDDDEEEDETTKKERQRLHEEWLERERLAQEEFKLKCEREEAAKKRKEEEERMIKEEWEAQQRREQEEQEKKQREKRDREQEANVLLNLDTKRKSLTSTFRSHKRDEAVQKRLDEAESQLENGGPWMNPEAPVTENSENYGTERDVANCPFFLKTGACRFGDRCSRKHDYPSSSPTLMIRSMFITFGMEQSRRDDYEMDAGLEHSEEDLQEHFLDFYHDVLPEFRSVGKVVQFKVSCNHESHLRGNVYIQFDTEEQCKEAFIKFNGRWYAGRQLHCEFCPVTRWKNAICGLFDRQKCPKGKHCNFLHVFRNPGNEFWEADRDLHLSPDAGVRRSRRDGWHSERYGDRSWRQRRSRSPLRSERSHSRPEGDRRRSRSRDRRTSHQQREDQRGSRYSDRSRARYRSRSRDKSRSRSRDRDRRRKRSRDTDREHKYRSVSEGRDSGGEDSDGSGRSRNRSPKKDNKKEKTPKVDGSTHRHHKHSKKSKKKSKKKHKKKRDEGTTSSGESEKENPSSPSPEIKDTEQHQGGNGDGNSGPEVTSDCAHTEIKTEPGENGNISTS